MELTPGFRHFFTLILVAFFTANASGALNLVPFNNLQNPRFNNGYSNTNNGLVNFEKYTLKPVGYNDIEDEFAERINKHSNMEFIDFDEKDVSMNFIRNYYYQFCKGYDRVQGSIGFMKLETAIFFGISNITCTNPKEPGLNILGADIYNPEGVLTVHMFPHGSASAVMDQLIRMKFNFCYQTKGVSAEFNFVTDNSKDNPIEKFVLQFLNCV